MLSLLSSIYGMVADVRNLFYERGLFESCDLGARTVSIGNITTGGTGKTPLVAYVAAILAERGETVCILTRGYGRKDAGKRVLVSDGSEILAEADESGDEPFELAKKLIGMAIVIADANRVAAGQWAKRKFGVTTFILDDGFQHRRAKRDVDIVCIDATNPFGGGKMLPAGRLREPLHNLQRADVVVITRANLAGDISNLRSELSDLNATAAIFEAQNKIVRIVALEDFHANPQSTRSEEKKLTNGSGWNLIGNKCLPNTDAEVRVAAFCALGNPESFFSQLTFAFETETTDGVALSMTKPFPDHHIYTQNDIAGLEKQASESGVNAFLTTAKDAVKLSNLKFEIPCFVVKIDISLNEAEMFSNLI